MALGIPKVPVTVRVRPCVSVLEEHSTARHPNKLCNLLINLFHLVQEDRCVIPRSCKEKLAPTPIPAGIKVSKEM